MKEDVSVVGVTEEGAEEEDEEEQEKKKRRCFGSLREEDERQR